MMTSTILMANSCSRTDHPKAPMEAKDLCFNDKPRWITFTHMGIPYWSHDLHSRAPDLSVVNSVFDDCDRLATYYRPLERLGEDVFRGELFRKHNSILFVNSIEFNCSRAFYNLTVPKCPLRVKVSYRHRSGPHVTTQETLMLPDRAEEPLVTRIVSSTFMDVVTRRPATEPPKFYTDELDGKETGSDGLRVKRLPPRPVDAFMHRVLIVFSHCDWNNHANFKTYLTLCLETLQHALTTKEVPLTHVGKKLDSGALSKDQVLDRSSATEPDDLSKNQQPRWLTSEIVKHGVKTARLRYLGEAVLGEELCVYLWQEEDKPHWVFFSMESENPSRPRVRFEMSVEYYGPPAKL